MKIEGMQYPLPTRRLESKSGRSSHEQGMSDDAVYFEADEEKRRQQGQTPEEHTQKQDETLDAQVAKESENSQIPSIPGQPVPSVTKGKEKPSLNIIV